MKKLKINFSATRKFEEIDYYFKLVIRRALVATLENRKFPFDAEVSVTLCDGGYIREINKKFRNKDKETDVLSFPQYEDGDFSECSGDFGACLGDIVISIPKAKAQAKEIGNPFLVELAFLTIHSALHLLGFDHERSKEEEELQCRLQKEICSSIEI